MRLKVFISQPMRGLSEKEILATREKAMDHVRRAMPDEDVCEIPSYTPAFKDVNPVVSLGHSVELMGEANLIVFCDGWHRNPGCRIEYEIAKAYGLQYILLSEHLV